MQRPRINALPAKPPPDIEICKRILELDPAVRVALFVEGDEVTAFAQSERASSALNREQALKTKIGYWVRIVTEIAVQTDKLFGATEYVSVTHQGLKMVTVPLSSTRSLGLSLDRSADSDFIVSKIGAVLGITRRTS